MERDRKRMHRLEDTVRSELSKSSSESSDNEDQSKGTLRKKTKKSSKKHKSSKDRHKKKKKKDKDKKKRNSLQHGVQIKAHGNESTCRGFLPLSETHLPKKTVETAGSSPPPEPSSLIGPSAPTNFETGKAGMVLEGSKSSRSYAPMTPEEYSRLRNTVRRVVDPDTGRSRLIKGEGEVLEEIVSRDRHKEINKAATKGDGNWFQQQLKDSLS